jgi:hypothetical protein
VTVLHGTVTVLHGTVTVLRGATTEAMTEAMTEDREVVNDLNSIEMALVDRWMKIVELGNLLNHRFQKR